MARKRLLIAGVSVFATVAAVLAAMFAAGFIGISSAGAHASTGVGPAEVSAAVHHDVSPPLRDIPSRTPVYKGSPDRPLRLIGPDSTVTQSPGALQTTVGPRVATTNGLNFNGIGDTSNTPLNPCNCAPPDTEGAVGATQYVQWVNTAFAVYDKTTGAIANGFPKAGNTLWSGFGGGCETNNDGDPIVQYDKIASRWVFTQFSVSTTPFLQCVAVSTTSDATGPYNRYSFSYGATQFNDYPKLGVWPDASTPPTTSSTTAGPSPAPSCAPSTAQACSQAPPPRSNASSSARASAACYPPTWMALSRRWGLAGAACRRPARRT